MRIANNFFYYLFVAARINHDCLPNCRKYFAVDKSQGGNGRITMVVKASRNIQAGEELTICYTPPIFSTTVRQMILTQTKVSMQKKLNRYQIFTYQIFPPNYLS